MAAFAPDKFTAYEQFEARILRPGETVDVYLADLRKLSVLFGGVPDSAMACVFVQGLPDPVKSLLRSSARADDMSLEELLARARAIIKDETAEREPVVAAVQPSQTPRSSLDMGPLVTCYECNGPNHFARDCMKRRRATNARYYRCNKTGHLAKNCPGNGSGDETSVPVHSPNSK